MGNFPLGKGGASLCKKEIFPGKEKEERSIWGGSKTDILPNDILFYNVLDCAKGGHGYFLLRGRICREAALVMCFRGFEGIS